LSIGGAEDLMLVIYHADAGSGDAEKLALLASAALPTRGATEVLGVTPHREGPPASMTATTT
jgi:hypothetical protein